MISDAVVKAITNAAKALATGAKDTGYTGNGLRKLDFKVNDTVYTAIQQNPNKLSVPAKMQREGHEIIQIRDDNKGVLIGNVDVTENRFNSYDAIPQVVDIAEIEKALGSAAVTEPGDVKVTAARTSVPANPVPTDREDIFAPSKKIA